MAQSRYYSATAIPTTLVGSVTPSTTTIVVSATTGFPASTPFILALDYGTPSEEVVLVTAVAGTSLTVTRAYDGTSGTSHNTGAPVRHTWTAMDGNDSRAHEAATSGVHGISALSNVVGTTDTQTLTNKTLNAPVITGAVNIANPNITGTVTGGATYQNIGITGTTTGNATYLNPTLQADIDANASSIIKLRSGTQTGNLTNWQNSTGTTLASVSPTGAASFPSEAVGSTGQMTVDTNGRIRSTTMTTGYGETSTASSTFSNTSYAALTPTVQVTCVAPPSGKVQISGFVHQDSNSGHFTFSSINVTGSVSGVIRAPADPLSAMTGATSSYAQATNGMTFVITSANPGETITAEWQHHVDASGGFGIIYGKSLTVNPLIG